MTLIIFGSCIIALVLLIWFRTDAWLEYTRVFHLNFLSLYREYDNRKKEDLTLKYIHFLRLHHDGFFTRLITCPICISVWLGIIICFTGVAITLSIKALLLMPVMVIIGLLLFTILDYLLG